MTLEEYLTPDPNIPPPITSPELIVATKPSRASRKFSLRDKGSVRGAIYVNGYKTTFESEGEHWVAFAYLAIRRVVDILDQPEAIEFVDDDGEIRHHTFDFLVTLDDGTRILVAAKPSALVEKSGIERIIELVAEQMSPSVADYIKLVTEKHLPHAVKANAKLIYDVTSSAANPAADAAVAKAIANMRGDTTVDDLIKVTGLKGKAFRAIVRAIADGRLELVRYGAINDDTLLRRTNRKDK